MKCPKCGYLGFETADRCRNCGYDFSLAVTPPSNTELPLNEGKRGGDMAWADFDLGRDPASSPTLATTGLGPNTDQTLGSPPPDLDLDRMIGGPDPEAAQPVTDGAALPREPLPSAVVPAEGRPAGLPPAHEARSHPGAEPGVGSPRPVGPPLAVRRTTPEMVRSRPRPGRPARYEPRPLLADPEDERPPEPGPVRESAPARAVPTAGAYEPAPRGVRLLAAAIDLLLMTGIDAAVLYLTLAITGLSAAEWRLIPAVPMVSFLLILNGGYLAAFTAAGGRTIGKMATGIRIIGDDGLAIDVPGAVLRAAGGLLTVLALGLPYLPALLSPEGRTLADRLAGTRVVRGD